MKKTLLTLITSITLITHNANALDDQTFEKLIKTPNFQVKISSSDLKTLHQASTLIISCVDFRLRDETTDFFSKTLKLLDDYDEITMPGASLAVVEKKLPAWNESITNIIEILEKLHHIKRVILFDHKNCGAYKLIRGSAHTQTPELETEEHRKVLLQAKEEILSKFPNLKVYTMLMDLEGNIENFQN